MPVQFPVGVLSMQQGKSQMATDNIHCKGTSRFNFSKLARLLQLDEPDL